MEQYHFDSYEAYKQSQVEFTRRKIRRGRTRCFTHEHVVQLIREYHPSPVALGLCHGVRLGHELNLFEKIFPEARWQGTEITEELCDGSRILNRDFSEVENSWIGKFDLIYSNSFDHSRDPWVTIKAWVACLSPTGRVYIEWTPWHSTLGRKSTADCFAASASEYRSLLEQAAGRVVSITTESTDCNRMVFAVW